MKWPFGKRVNNTPPTTIDDCLSTVRNAAQICRFSADALETTDLDSFHKASLIAQYEPNRFETDVEYSEARIARDAAVAAQDAANGLQEAALALSIALKGDGYDLSAASFAEVGSKAMKVDSSSVYDKAPALRDAASQAQSHIGEYRGK